MNHLAKIENLKNRYFALRHGESKANTRGIILSDPRVGVPYFGLTSKGRTQIFASVKEKRQDLRGKVVIYSSDFRRARESAEIASRILDVPVIRYVHQLRERWFGGWEGRSNRYYDNVWKRDAKDASHKDRGVESVENVLDDGTRLVADLERLHRGAKIVLASHGDRLQILQTAFARVPPSKHRSLLHLQTGELRELVLA